MTAHLRITPFVLLFATSLLSAPARSQDKPPPIAARSAEADVHFKRGVVLTERKLYREALTEFLAAYESLPHYAVLYNIGLLYVELGEASRAITTFNEYLSQGGGELAATRRSQVVDLISKQRKLLGTTVFEIEPPGARVFLDGESIGESPLSALPVSAGVHYLVVTKPGYEVAQQRVDVRAGATTPARVQLKALAEQHEGGELTASCPTPNARLWVDGRPTSELPSSIPLKLATGSHAYEFEAPGHHSERGEVEIGNGVRTSIECSLLPADPPAASGKSRGSLENAKSDGASATRDDVWLYVSAGAALLLAAGSVSAWAMGEKRFDEYRDGQKHLQSVLDESGADQTWIDAEARTHETLDAAYDWRLLAAGLGVGAAAAAAFGIYLFVEPDHAQAVDQSIVPSKRTLGVGWRSVW